MVVTIRLMMYSILIHRESEYIGVCVAESGGVCIRLHWYARHAGPHLNSLYGTRFSASTKLLTHAGVGLTRGTGCELCNWLASTRPVWAH